MYSTVYMYVGGRCIRRTSLYTARVPKRYGIAGISGLIYASSCAVHACPGHLSHHLTSPHLTRKLPPPKSTAPR